MNIKNISIRGVMALSAMFLVTSCATSVVQQGKNEGQSFSSKLYDSAMRFLPENANKLVLNGKVKHHWIGNTDSFWYARDTGAGEEYIVVDASNGEKRNAFNLENLADSLSRASGEKIGLTEFIVKDYDLVDGNGVVSVMAAKKQWTCMLVNNNCALAPASIVKPGEVLSPDGKWAVFAKKHNLYLRSLTDNSEKALTTDGHEHYSYGKLADSSTQSVSMSRIGMILPPIVIWSADSKRLITQKLDERKVKDLHLLQYAPETGAARPVLHSYRSALLGDEHITQAEIFIFDVEKNTQVKMKHNALDVLFMSPLTSGRIWWHDNQQQFYVVPTDLYSKKQQLLVVDANTGETTNLIEESSETYIEAGPTVGDAVIKTLASGQVILWSERDGWGHLYHYDKNGQLIKQITQGQWQVRTIVAIDEKQNHIIFTAGGREVDLDPYYLQLYIINFDGSNLRRLSKNNQHNEIVSVNNSPIAALYGMAVNSAEASFSPSGNYFISTVSTPNEAPVTLLKSAQGDLISIIETADISALEASGLVLPEPYSVIAADGKTLLYGNIFRPSYFDASKSYPVLDSIYPGPQVYRTTKSFMSSVFDRSQAQMLAELGFIVITIDGRGTPGRSKAFHNVSYGDLGQAGNLKDHISGIKQLANRYPYMDLTRVGIYGHSGGGFASTRAMFDYPEFYKVAVSSAGNHDQRGYLLVWGGNYQGPYSDESYVNSNNSLLVGNLKGELLLMHGDMDDNVHPAHTMQVVNALIKADKDFDMVILPNQAHGFKGAAKSYFTRKRANYFIEHLLKLRPLSNN